jgi:hypothetical protein
MKCELCGNDIGEIPVSLPLKKADGSISTMACLKCAEKSPAYCKKHERPHLGFFDDTTACIYCIEEMVTENRKKEVSIANDLRQKLPPKEFMRLLEWANESSFVTGSSGETCILRAIATKAKRSSQSIKEVLEKIIETKSIEYILPLESVS